LLTEFGHLPAALGLGAGVAPPGSSF